MSRTIEGIIDDILRAEGGYVSNPNDRGGPTRFGITEEVARASGYTGNMRDFPEQLARNIYYNQYVTQPGFDKIFLISPEVAAELVDTGVNMGPKVSTVFLQRALNLFDKKGEAYSPLKVDGALGPATISAFQNYLANRKSQAIPVMLKALNCLQGNRYIELAEGNPTQKEFIFGWLANRVSV